MTDWFDENNNAPSSQEDKPEVNAPEEKPDGSNLDTEFSTPNEQEAQPKNEEWASTPPVTPPVTPTWNQPNQASGNQEPNNAVPSWNFPNQAGGSQATGPVEQTSYHYGVNAQNPVPNNTNDYSPQYSQQQQYNNNGYNPQGGYNQYGWQSPPPQQPSGNTPPPPKPPKKKKGATIAIAILSVTCATAIITLSVLLAMAFSKNNINKQNGSNNNASSTSGKVNSNAPNLEIAENDADAQGLSTSSIVQMNLHSTVVITIYDRVNTYGFGGSHQVQEVGAASGIIMSEDGYIITNMHVVSKDNGQPYEHVDVKTYDGTVYKDAEVVGADRDTDLAVIKVSAVKLEPAKFGDSSALKLGDKIVAIGNAGGLAWTTTQGIVSGLARDVYEDTGYSIKCLQIDAAINPGNSGGPLLNSQGQVVGINSAKIAAEGYEGLGFSIPIKEAESIVNDLIKYGYVKNRVMLGVTGLDITQPGYEGFQIQSINDNSPLSGTKVEVGDIITKIDNVVVDSGITLRNEMSKHKVGDRVTLTLMRVDPRSGKKSNYTISCKLTEYSE
ncbi:MAG: trypsin-like peptidase domain-containing protein [Oscillospiraceae bacterium]|nr:trypsin-like peptidase domain-containing protein [Oscillospiraceae bacterium]MDD4545660.1 trypsin-like peptidase domain-containing protein [Oscillospiraceae bacterium]